MNLKNAKNFLSLFHYHIAKQSTGNPDEFAAKLGVSRSTLYRYIADLRDEGVEVRFSRYSNNFYYTTPTQVELASQVFEESAESEVLQKEGQCLQGKLTEDNPSSKEMISGGGYNVLIHRLITHFSHKPQHKKHYLFAQFPIRKHAA